MPAELDDKKPRKPNRDIVSMFRHPPGEPLDLSLLNDGNVPSLREREEFASRLVDEYRTRPLKS